METNDTNNKHFLLITPQYYMVKVLDASQYLFQDEKSDDDVHLDPPNKILFELFPQ